MDLNKMKWKKKLKCISMFFSFYFKFVCFSWQCVRNFPLMNLKPKLDLKIFKRKNLVLIFWNFLEVCTNLKSCMYSTESQRKIWSTPTLLWAVDFFWPSTDAHSPIVSFLTWLNTAITQGHSTCGIVNRWRSNKLRALNVSMWKESWL